MLAKEQKAKMNRKMNSICWTLNNWTDEEEFALLFPELPITYICWGEEVGEQGTRHLQGYAEFSYSVRFGTLKGYPGFGRMHIEERQGTQDQAIAYTKKDGLWIEIGTKRRAKKRGDRLDLDDARVAARDVGMREVAQWGSLQEIKVAEKYLTYCETKRNWKPTVIWLYGETGTGKSRMAHQMYPEAYTKSDSSKWWEGYDGHREVILDDFRGDWMPFHEMLTLLDRYERRVEFKGGSRQMLAETIVITSCHPPEEVYSGVCRERMDQLLRRIDITENLGANRVAPCPEVGGVILGPPSLDEGHHSTLGVCSDPSDPALHPHAPESRGGVEEPGAGVLGSALFDCLD